jgi:hypothetical protein
MTEMHKQSQGTLVFNDGTRAKWYREEYLPYEPSAYHYDEGLLVFVPSVKGSDRGNLYFISTVDGKVYGEDWYAEDAYTRLLEGVSCPEINLMIQERERQLERFWR